MKTLAIDGATVIAPEQRQIDVMNSAAFGKALTAAFDPSKDIILDLSAVLFIDSSGLGEIIRLVRTVHEQGRKAVLCGAGDAVSVLFDMVRIDQLVPIAPDADSARQILKDGPAG